MGGRAHGNAAVSSCGLAERVRRTGPTRGGEGTKKLERSSTRNPEAGAVAGGSWDDRRSRSVAARRIGVGCHTGAHCAA